MHSQIINFQIYFVLHSKTKKYFVEISSTDTYAIDITAIIIDVFITNNRMIVQFWTFNLLIIDEVYSIKSQLYVTSTSKTCVNLIQSNI